MSARSPTHMVATHISTPRAVSAAIEREGTTRKHKKCQHARGESRAEWFGALFQTVSRELGTSTNNKLDFFVER
jgi:hypothetical protein